MARHLILRLSVPALGLTLLAGLAALYTYAAPLYFHLLTGLGVVPFRYPFVDGQYVLATIECWHLGIDVYITNPCDVLERPHGYSPLWLLLPSMPMNLTTALGLTLAATVLLSLSVLTPTRRGREFVLFLVAAASPMVVFALERANIDLIVFILVIGAGSSLVLSSRWRLLVYPLVLLAALLKIYPVTLLVLPLRERPRMFLAVIAASLAVVAVFVAVFRAELVAMMPNIPSGPYFTDLFGAANLPLGVAQLLAHGAASPGALSAQIRVLPLAILLVALLLAALPAVRMLLELATREGVASLPARECLFLVSGSALICGCFLVGQSVGYRGIHLLLVLPGLLTLARAAPRPQDRARFWNISIVVVFLMWGDFFRYWLSVSGLDQARFALWLVRELLWWRLVGILAGVLLCFAADSPFLHQFQRGKSTTDPVGQALTPR
jgi:hypothetical protein